MKDVSRRVLQATAEALATHKSLPLQEVLRYAPFPEVASPDWYTWEDFVQWIEHLNESPLAPIDWRRIGAQCHDSPTLLLFRSFWRMAFSIKTAYWLACKWLGPSSFPAIVSRYEELSRNQIRLTLTLPPRLSPCRSLFELCEGNLSSAPVKIFGLAPAKVEAQITAHQAIYLITLPAQLSFVSRLWLAVRALTSFRTLLAELADQQELLQEQSMRISSTQTEFHNLLETFPDGVFIHKQGTIVYVNPSMTTYLGYNQPSALIGSSALAITHDESKDLAQKRMAAVQAHALAVTPPAEISFNKHNSADPFLAEVVGLAITWQGQPATLVMCRDLTDRKKLQAHLMLRDRMTSLGVLAAGVGHEINNPLGYTKLNLEALEGSLQKGDAQATRHHLDEMNKGLERIRLIVKDLKSFSRAPDETGERATAAVELPSVLLSVINMARNEIEYRARLRVEITDLPPVIGNEARLGQVFLNLMLNAAQAIPPGKREHNEVILRTRVDEQNRVVIEIQDTGTGMTEETKSRIFDPFFTTKAVGHGTGLGLSICHSIIRDMQGSIEFESTIGKGTAFRVLLPALEKSASTPALHTPTARPEKIRGKVMIIDDDHALLKITQYFVSQEHHALSFTSARKALEILKSGENFDCIICDLMMPDMTGIEFHQAVGQHSPRHLPLILFVTGGSFTQETDLFLNRPEIKSLEKPFEAAQLSEHVRQKIEISRKIIGR